MQLNKAGQRTLQENVDLIVNHLRTRALEANARAAAATSVASMRRELGYKRVCIARLYAIADAQPDIAQRNRIADLAFTLTQAR